MGDPAPTTRAAQTPSRALPWRGALAHHPDPWSARGPALAGRGPCSAPRRNVRRKRLENVRRAAAWGPQPPAAACETCQLARAAAEVAAWTRGMTRPRLVTRAAYFGFLRHTRARAGTQARGAVSRASVTSVGPGAHPCQLRHPAPDAPHPVGTFLGDEERCPASFHCTPTLHGRREEGAPCEIFGNGRGSAARGGPNTTGSSHAQRPCGDRRVACRVSSAPSSRPKAPAGQAGARYPRRSLRPVHRAARGLR